MEHLKGNKGASFPTARAFCF